MHGRTHAYHTYSSQINSIPAWHGRTYAMPHLTRSTTRCNRIIPLACPIHALWPSFGTTRVLHYSPPFGMLCAARRLHDSPWFTVESSNTVQLRDLDRWSLNPINFLKELTKFLLDLNTWEETTVEERFGAAKLGFLIIWDERGCLPLNRGWENRLKRFSGTRLRIHNP